VLAAAVAVLAVPVVIHLREAPRLEPQQVETEIVVPPTTDPVSMALSPDGQRLVFAAKNNGRPQLWLRALAAGVLRPIAGTEGGERPFWSPNGRSLGFFAEGKLKVLDLDRGEPRVVADAIGARGGAWNAEGVILFASSAAGPLFRVAATGGAASAVTTKRGQQLSHLFPQFLSDGRHFLFYARGTPEAGGVFIGSLDSPEITRLTPADAAGVYLAPDWLLWTRDDALVAQRLNLQKLQLEGAILTVGRAVTSQSQASALTASASGLVAYRAGATYPPRQLVWYDRQGRTLGTLGGPDADGGLWFPRLSPDGTRASVYRTLKGNPDIWILDGVHMDRFTIGPGAEMFATWSPDGRQIGFDSDRSGIRQLYVKATSGDDAERLLVESSINKATPVWSPDGRFILFNDIKAESYDIGIVSLTGDRKAQKWLSTAFDEKTPDFSPDGRWVAYQSNQSGRYEIHVRAFVPPGERADATQGRQMSTAGGISPVWAKDRPELYYIAPDGMLTSVAVKATSSAIEFGTPMPLFHLQIAGGSTEGQQGRQYDVSRDGRFLVNTLLDDTTPITLLQNWRSAP
jgi:Tol biopolymer transport system component